jgi:hypothetical protein
MLFKQLAKTEARTKLYNNHLNYFEIAQKKFTLKHNVLF